MENKPRVLHLIQSLRSGGCENMLIRTLPCLQDFEHRILTLKEPGELESSFKEKGITVTSLHQKSLFELAAYKRLVQEVEEYRPDIILTYLFHADMIGRLFLQKKVWVPLIPFLRTTYSHPRYLPALILEFATKPLARQYLANSEAVKDFYSRKLGVPSQKITVIENGLEKEVYTREYPAGEIRKENNLPEDSILILCVANLHKNKGHAFLLEAFEEVSQEFPKTVLLLVGEGEERKTLEKKASALGISGRVRFLGRRSDVPSLLGISDIFAFPTLFEGMSNALLEAMASGKAILTTNIPENQILLTDEKTALLVPPKNKEALRKGLERLLKEEDLRERLGKNAQREAGERFSLEAVCKKWEAFVRTNTAL